EWMNGRTPEWLQDDVEDLERRLQTEREACDLVLRALAGDELVARSAAAATWVVEHAAEWTALCRDITLTAVRLEALEQRAQTMIGELEAGTPGLPLAEFIGRGVS